MRGHVAAVFMVVAVSAATPAVAAQSTPCTGSLWAEQPGSHQTVQPGGEQYKARVSVYSQAGCPQAAACPGSGPEARFDVRSAPRYLTASFEPNPANVTGGNGPVDSRTTVTMLSFHVDPRAPFNQSFQLGIRVTCGSLTYDILHQFRVGSNAALAATVDNSTPDRSVYQWTVHVANVGNRDVRVSAEPVATPTPPTSQNWTLPSPVTLGQPGPASISETNLSVALGNPMVRTRYAVRLHFAPVEARQDPDQTLDVALPLALFEGHGTPISGVVAVLAIVLGTWFMRRKGPSAAPSART